MDKEQLWKGCLAEMEMELPEAIYKTWLSGTNVLEQQGSVIKIGTKNAYAKNKLETRYLSKIKNSLDRLTGTKNIVKFVVDIKSEEDKKQKSNLGPLFKNDQEKQTSPFQKQYTFDNYVVGPNNNIAFAVAQAVAQNPGKAHNPFFVYSPVGLGKTHLIQAIGNYLHQHHPNLNVIYCTAEEFTNELIESIRNPTMGRNTAAFRKKFRHVDVLLIDDIHFIAGRESTQEEFFNTFNSLYLNNKQLVLTSDRSPKDIKKLENRLSSRFSSGMIADIQPPDVDMRKAILLHKVSSGNIKINDNVLEMLAQMVTTNIRELEGTLNQVVTTAKALQQEPNIQMVIDIANKLKISGTDMYGSGKPGTINPQGIIKQVIDYYQISQKDLKGKGRSKQIANARQIAMYLLRTKVGCTLSQVGELLGGRDHSTVIHGVGKVERLNKQSQEIHTQLKHLEQRINQISTSTQ